MSQIISKEEARQILQNTTKDGKIFTVDFVKRTNGQVRKMNCRKGVSKGVNGHGQAFDAASRGLLSVFDMKLLAHRFVSLESILRLSIRGRIYIVS